MIQLLSLLAMAANPAWPPPVQDAPNQEQVSKVPS